MYILQTEIKVFRNILSTNREKKCFPKLFQLNQLLSRHLLIITEELTIWAEIPGQCGHSDLAGAFGKMP